MYNRRLGRGVRALVLTCLLAIVAGTPALAGGGFTVGVGSTLPYRGAPVINGHVIYEVHEFAVHAELLRVSVRADATYAFGLGAAPALALSGVLNSDSGAYHPIERYLGLGGGLSFTGPGFNGPTTSLVIFSGARFPLLNRLSAFAQAQVTATPSLIVPSLGFGLEYTIGGTE